MRQRFTQFMMLTAVMLIGSMGMVNGQAHSFTATGLTYSQNFDVMGATGTTYPTGWEGARVAGTGTTAVVLVVTDGGANSGAPYNVGTVASAERALGTLASASTIPAIGASFVNNTGGVITGFNINAFMEQWRSGSSATVNEVVRFQYSFNATSLNDANATWDSVVSLNLNEILTTTTAAAAVDGNLPANRQAISGAATGLSWATGATLWIRWRDTDDAGSDGLYAVDDFSMAVTTGATQTTSIVTFRVNMQYQTVGANGVRIAGNFQGWSPSATPMVRSLADTNVWTYSDTFNIGDTLRYKFINGNAWGQDESVPAACAVGGDRFYVVAGGNPALPLVCFGACTNCMPMRTVTFRVDMTGQTVTGRVHIAGSFNGFSATADSMVPQGNNIYARSYQIQEGTTVTYKFLNGPSFANEETVPAACGVPNGFGGFNRQYVVPGGNAILPAVIFGTCAAAQPILSIRPISNYKGVDSLGVLDSLNQLIKVTGVVYGVNQYSSSTTPIGVQFVVIDSTGGLAFRKAGTNFGLANLAEGDSVIITGVLEQFNGLAQINPDTIERVATNRTLRQPIVVTNVTEATESQLIRINNLNITGGTWPAAGQSSNITVSNGTSTFTMRIIAQTNIPGTTAPTGPFDAIGLGGQFDNSSPFTSGYQLFPRRTADIIPVTITTPTINFGRTDTLVNNQTGSFAMTMNILNPVATAAQVRVRITSSPGASYGGTYQTNPAAVNDTITLNVPANGALTGYALLLFPNIPVGRTDTLTFTIISATAGIQIGALNSSRVRIQNPVPPSFVNATIAQIRGNNTNGIADSNGVRVRTTGLVLGFNKRTAGLEFTIYDRSSNTGIGIFRASGNLGYNVTEGDSIRVVGTVGHFNGLAQINVDSVFVINSGNALPPALVVTAMGENTESRLIRINNVTVIDPAQWPIAGTTGTGRTVRVTNGVDSFDLRIPSGVDVFGTPVPVGSFDMVGLGSQFDNSAPHTTGYQLIPRYIADIVTGAAGGDSIRSFALLFPANNAALTVEGPGTTSIDIRWNAARWSGGAANFTYQWLVDLPTGDFSNPLATIPSNNAGADTTLTLNFTAIAALLDANGIPQGVPASIKWTVRASRTGSTNTRLASPFNLTLTRGIISSVENSNPLEAMKLYPNPANSRAYLSYTLPSASTLQLEVVNMIGKRVSIETLPMTSEGIAEIELAKLPEGVYFIRLSNTEFSAVRRLVVKH
ncbi:MAG: T9SS type A sorting domain-containing protein [Sphingobacteriaceae bacterium]|nr:T9SS type A sorting domain-containing protein [Sphingobacteriaceae bacterium]